MTLIRCGNLLPVVFMWLPVIVHGECFLALGFAQHKPTLY